MKNLTIFLLAFNIAFVLAGGPVFTPSPSEDDEIPSPGNCPNCATGQLDPAKNTFEEYLQFNLIVKKNAADDGNCPGNRCKRLIESRVIDGEVYGRICCCEPTNNKWVKEFPCADPPKYV